MSALKLELASPNRYHERLIESAPGRLVTTKSTTLKERAVKPDLIELITGRIGQDFDGECHLAEHEARSIIVALSEASKEIERLREALGELVSMYEGVCGNLPFGMMGRSEIAADLAKAKAALQPILPSGGGRGEQSSSVAGVPCQLDTRTQHSAGGE